MKVMATDQFIIVIIYKQETWIEGECPKWDSFDLETAYEMLETAYAMEEQRRKQFMLFLTPMDIKK
jgi:hypothetical protein